MRKALFFSIVLLCFNVLSAQTLKKYPIGNTGSSIYMMCDPGNFKMDMSPDSSKVYTGECHNAHETYGLIYVAVGTKMKSLDDAEKMLISYIDYLKTQWKIKEAVGYGKGNHLNNNEKTRGVVDYWKDEEGDNWKMKGWTDGSHVAVLYVYTKETILESQANIFLDGLRFKGM